MAKYTFEPVENRNQPKSSYRFEPVESSGGRYRFEPVEDSAPEPQPAPESSTARPPSPEPGRLNPVRGGRGAMGDKRRESLNPEPPTQPDRDPALDYEGTPNPPRGLSPIAPYGARQVDPEQGIYPDTRMAGRTDTGQRDRSLNQAFMDAQLTPAMEALQRTATRPVPDTEKPIQPLADNVRGVNQPTPNPAQRADRAISEVRGDVIAPSGVSDDDAARLRDQVNAYFRDAKNNKPQTQQPQKPTRGTPEDMLRARMQDRTNEMMGQLESPSQQNAGFDPAEAAALAGRAGVRGAVGLGEAALGVAEFAYDTSPILRAIDELSRRAGGPTTGGMIDAIQEEARRIRSGTSGTYGDALAASEEAQSFNPGSWKWWLENGTETGMQFIPQLALGLASGGAGFAGAASTQVFGQSYADAKQEVLDAGVSEDVAILVAGGEASVNAAITYLTSKIPFEAVERAPGIRSLARNAATRIVSRIGTGALGEGAQEVIEGTAQDAIAGARQSLIEGERDFRRIIQASMDEAGNLDRRKAEFLLGALMGGPMGAVVDAQQSGQRRKKAAQSVEEYADEVAGRATQTQTSTFTENQVDQPRPEANQATQEAQEEETQGVGEETGERPVQEKSRDVAAETKPPIERTQDEVRQQNEERQQEQVDEPRQEVRGREEGAEGRVPDQEEVAGGRSDIAAQGREAESRLRELEQRRRARARVEEPVGEVETTAAPDRPAPTVRPERTARNIDIQSLGIPRRPKPVDQYQIEAQRQSAARDYVQAGDTTALQEHLLANDPEYARLDERLQQAEINADPQAIDDAMAALDQYEIDAVVNTLPPEALADVRRSVEAPTETAEDTPAETVVSEEEQRILDEVREAEQDIERVRREGEAYEGEAKDVQDNLELAQDDLERFRGRAERREQGKRFKRRVFDAMQEAWRRGETINISNAYRIQPVSPDRKDLVRLGPTTGDIQVRRGRKNWDSIGSETLQDLANQLGVTLDEDARAAGVFVEEAPNERSQATSQQVEQHFLFLERDGKRVPVAGPYESREALNADRQRVDEALARRDVFTDFDARVAGVVRDEDTARRHAERVRGRFPEGVPDNTPDEPAATDQQDEANVPPRSQSPTDTPTEPAQQNTPTPDTPPATDAAAPEAAPEARPEPGAGASITLTAEGESPVTGELVKETAKFRYLRLPEGNTRRFSKDKWAVATDEGRQDEAAGDQQDDTPETARQQEAEPAQAEPTPEPDMTTAGEGGDAAANAVFEGMMEELGGEQAPQTPPTPPEQPTAPREAPRETPPTPPEQPARQQRGEQARQELRDAIDEFGDLLDGRLGANQALDPAVLKAAGKVLAKGVKAGYYSFNEAVGNLHEAFKAKFGDERGREMMDAAAPAIETAWQRAREVEPRMSESGRVADVIAEPVADTEAGTTEESVLTFEQEARQLIESDQTAQQKNAAMRRIAKRENDTEKAIQERIEGVLVVMSHEVAQDPNLTPRQRYDRLIELYNKQPRFSKRTSTSTRLQAYSTPVPLAWAASRMADISPASIVYEPTAGHGALLMEADVNRVWSNELDTDRLDTLRRLGIDANRITADDARTYVPPIEADAIVANPPFGALPTDQRTSYEGFRIAKLDHLISVRALEALQPDGTAVLIVGANREPGRIAAADRVFMNYLYNHFNVISNFEVDGDLYRNQGASFPVRVIVLQGRKANPTKKKLAPDKVERLETWDAIYNQTQEVRNEITSRRTNLESNPEYAPSDAASGGIQGGSANQLRDVDDAAGTDAAATGERGGAVRDQGDDRLPDREPARTDGDTQRPDEVSPSVSPAPARDEAGTDALEGAGQADARPGVSGEQEGEGVRRGARARRLPDFDPQPVNDFQDAYQPSSTGTGLDTVIPSHLTVAVRAAQQDIIDQHGSIDRYVTDQLGYESIEQMHQAFAGEQVDGVAMALYQMERSGALVVGDQTGIGKGRQVAGVMRWARLNNVMPVFFTKDYKLYSDMYRDLVDIGETNINPLLMASNVDAAHLRDAGGRIQLRSSSQATQRGIMRKFMQGEADLAGDYDFTGVFVTYPQVQQPNEQQRFLEALARSRDVVIVLDEAHEAAGKQSMRNVYMVGGQIQLGKGSNRRTETYRGLLKQPGIRGVTYSSATFAKRPETMPLYFKTDLQYAVREQEKLIEIMQAGGVPLQQHVTNAVAQAGQYIRREKDFSGVPFEFRVRLGKQSLDDVVGRLDDVAERLRALRDFGESVKASVEDMQDAKATSNVQSTLGVTPFANVLHNYISQMLLSTKADAVVEAAVEAHRKGRKPVIALQNTMESFLNDFLDQQGLSVGDEVTVGYKDVLLRALDRQLRVTEKDAGGNSETKQYPPEALGLKQEYETTRALIESMDVDLPVSPIDHIRQRLEQAGLRTDEITGRQMTLAYGSDATQATVGKRPPSEINDKNRPVNAFNEGSVDALVINASGSTGLSLHASTKFKDQKPRQMIVAQPAGDINTFMQTLGRILRSGMVEDGAYYELLALPVEAERRPASVLTAKMKMLNANTTAAAEGQVDFEAPDIFNKYGDQVAAELLADDPDLGQMIDMLKRRSPTTGDVSAKEDDARKLTGRLAVYPNAVQKRVMDELIANYNQYVEALKATGEYDLDLVVDDNADAYEVGEAKLMEQGTDETDPFRESVYMRRYALKDTRKPPTTQQVRDSINEAFGSDSDQARDTIAEQMEKLRTASQDWISRANTDTQREQRERIVREGEHAIQNFLDNDLLPNYGNLITLDVDDGTETYQAAFTGIRFPEPTRDRNSLRPSGVVVEMSLAAPAGRVKIPLTKLAGESITITPASGGLEVFDEAQRADFRDERYVMTGNVLRALEIDNKGKLIAFKTREGDVVRGIRKGRAWAPSQLQNDPRRELPTADAVLTYLRDTPQDEQVVGPDDLELRLAAGGTQLRMSVPRAKNRGGRYYQNEGLTDRTGEFESRGSRMVATFPVDELDAVVRYLDDAMNIRLRPEEPDTFAEELAKAKQQTPPFSTRKDQPDAQETTEPSPLRDPQSRAGRVEGPRGQSPAEAREAAARQRQERLRQDITLERLRGRLPVAQVSESPMGGYNITLPNGERLSIEPKSAAYMRRLALQNARGFFESLAAEHNGEQFVTQDGRTLTVPRDADAMLDSPDAEAYARAYTPAGMFSTRQRTMFVHRDHSNMETLEEELFHAAYALADQGTRDRLDSTFGGNEDAYHNGYKRGASDPFFDAFRDGSVFQSDVQRAMGDIADRFAAQFNADIRFATRRVQPTDRPLSDMGAVVAARAYGRGITSTGKPLYQLTREAVAEIAPETLGGQETKVYRKAQSIMRALREAEDTPEAKVEAFDRALAKQVKPTMGGRTVKQQVADVSGKAATRGDRGRTVTMTERQALKKRLQAEARGGAKGYKQGHREALAKIREQMTNKALTAKGAKQQIRQWIKTYVPKDMQGQMIPHVANAETLADLRRALRRIRDLRARDRVRTETLRGRRLNKKQYLTRVHHSRRGELMRLLSEINDVQNSVKQRKGRTITTEQRLTAADELDRLLTRVEEIFEADRQARIDQVIVPNQRWAKQTRRELQSKLAREDDLPTQEKRPDDTDTDRKRGIARSYASGLLTPENMYDNLSNRLKQEAVWRASDAEERVYLQDRDDEETMRRALLDEGMDPDGEEVRRFSRDMSGDYTLHSITLESGQTVKMTPAELISAIATLSDRSTRRLVLGGEKRKPLRVTLGAAKRGTQYRLTESDIADIEAVDPRYARIAAKLAQHIRSKGPQLDNATWRLRGNGIELSEDYYPRQRNPLQNPLKGAVDGFTKDLLPKGHSDVERQMLENLGFVKERTGGAATPLLIEDVFTHYNRYNHESNRLIHMAEVVRRLGMVTEQKDVKRLINRKRGTEMEDRLRWYQAELSGTARTGSSRLDRFGRAITRNVASAFVSGNVKSWGKALLGGSWSILSEVDTRHWQAGLRRVLDNDIDAVLQAESGYFWHRHQHEPAKVFTVLSYERTASVAPGEASIRTGANVLLQDIAKGRPARTLEDIRAISAKVRGMTEADIRVARVAYGAAESEIRANHPDWSDDQVRKAAVKRSVQIFRRTQNGNSPIETTGLISYFRQSGLGQFYTMFASEPAKQLNYLYRGHRKGGSASKRSKVAYLGNVATSGTINVLGSKTGMAAAVAVLMGYQLTDDEEEKLLWKVAHSAVRDGVGLLPFLDMVGEFTVAEMQGYDGGEDLLPPPAQVMGDLMQGVYGLGEAAVAAFGDERYESGDNRGKRKADVKFERSLERTLTSGSILAGMPVAPVYWLSKSVGNAFSVPEGRSIVELDGVRKRLNEQRDKLQEAGEPEPMREREARLLASDADQAVGKLTELYNRTGDEKYRDRARKLAERALGAMGEQYASGVQDRRDEFRRSKKAAQKELERLEDR